MSEKIIYDGEDHVPHDITDLIHALGYVRVVRCKDCKYRKKITNCTYGECIYSASMVADNDFCSNGEKKEDKTQEEWEI